MTTIQQPTSSASDAMPCSFSFLSVCSGIEAASVAWEPLGWKACAFAEIEKFPSAVLAHHWPDVPNLGDMTKHNDWPDTLRPNLIVGGTPCQAFSVAGLRQGLADPRGNLTLVFLGLLAQFRPQWVVWENVPGVLSDKTGAFGAFLGGLGELGYGFAYRVLDAQYHGVAQRRRRVFVVGYLGDWRRAAAVLFEPESLRGDSPPSREAREGLTYDLAPCLAASGRGFERTGDTRSQDCVIPETVGTICADSHPGSYTGQDAYTGRLIPTAFGGDIARTLSARHDSSPCADRGMDVVAVPVAFNTYGGSKRPDRPDGGFYAETAVTSKTLDAATGLNPTAGQGGTCVAVPVAMINMQGSKGNAVAQADGPSFTLSAMHGHDVHAVAVPRSFMADDYKTGSFSEVDHAGPLTTSADRSRSAPVVAFAQNQVGEVRTGDVLNTLNTNSNASGRNTPMVQQSMQVRRLTPTECERLQGFPDGHTAIPWRGKPASECPDGPRYKALGNSMAVPVMRWIGERISQMNADVDLPDTAAQDSSSKSNNPAVSG